MSLFNNICEAIGNTPIIRLMKIEKEYNMKNMVYAKIEKLNPAGSIKDRVAYEMIEEGIKSNKINKNTIIVEATSGNTGIGLAMVCAYYNLKLIIVMPKSNFKNKIKILKAYGAKVILTSRKKGIEGAISKAKELESNGENIFYINQFSNEQNLLTHYNRTAEEILKDLNGCVDYVFIGMGSGGTITGIAKKLKEYNDNTKVIGIEPYNNPYYSKGISGKYNIPGIGSTFIPKIMNLDVIDDIVTVTDEGARKVSSIIASKEGILVGLSSGAVLAGANKYLKEKKIFGKRVILLFPDGGEKYLK